MTRLNVMLLIALVCSSLYLVKVSYESRRLFAELDRAQALALKLESDHERLLVDARAQATPLRVEKVARDRLGMRSATPAVTEYVVPPAPAAEPAPDAAEGRR
ncbi:cell division protein FtsL [Methylibium sp.]|uniref:cell division protein FtsL n=1 Tax=Methylibium sp. TaxID=2067992 RepID=UPI003D142EED